MSGDNYSALLEERVKAWAEENAEPKLDVAFMGTINELVLADHDLSSDEFSLGDMDGGLDGQIDSMFVIVNGVVITDPSEVPGKGPLEIEIVIIQSKNSTSFEANPLTIIRSTINDLLDLQSQNPDENPLYHDKLKATFSVAREVIRQTGVRTASTRVRAIYATKASTARIHPNVQDAAILLREALKSKAASDEATVEFFGAEELIQLARRPKIRERTFAASEVIGAPAGDSFACLVTVSNLMSFMSDDSGALIRPLFDANVRDFEGDVDVNRAIKAKLITIDEGGFWWFNNGVTIVADQVVQKGKTLTLKNPLVVNGLQTSNVVHSFMIDTSIDPELRAVRGDQLVLAKIIQPPSEEIRDQIITATNSQTNIPKPYLRGMDQVHRNIEDSLKSHGIFYERRKNQYRNLGKPRTSVVSLREMAQALMAALLFRPADARGRPNSLLSDDNDYETLFGTTYPLDTFKNVISAKRQIGARLAILYQTKPRSFRNDLVFHVLAYASASRFWTTSHAVQGWASLILTETEADEAVRTVAQAFEAAGATDKVAKSRTFQEQVRSLAETARTRSATTVDKLDTITELANLEILS